MIERSPKCTCENTGAFRKGLYVYLRIFSEYINKQTNRAGTVGIP